MVAFDTGVLESFHRHKVPETNTRPTSEVLSGISSSDDWSALSRTVEPLCWAAREDVSPRGTAMALRLDARATTHRAVNGSVVLAATALRVNQSDT